MAQNDINILILEAIEENNHLKQSRILLDIAVEQLAMKDTVKTLERIEVLLNQYVSVYNLHFEELETILKRLKSASPAINKPCVCKLK